MVAPAVDMAPWASELSTRERDRIASPARGAARPGHPATQKAPQCSRPSRVCARLRFAGHGPPTKDGSPASRCLLQANGRESTLQAQAATLDVDALAGTALAMVQHLDARNRIRFATDAERLEE